jgi:hypothetical protein
MKLYFALFLSTSAAVQAASFNLRGLAEVIPATIDASLGATEKAPVYTLCGVNVQQECPATLKEGESAKCGTEIISCVTPPQRSQVGCDATAFIHLHHGEDHNAGSIHCVDVDEDNNARHRSLINSGFYTIPSGKVRPGDLVEFGLKIENVSDFAFSLIGEGIKTTVTVDTQKAQEPVSLRDDYGVYQSYESSRGENEVELNYLSSGKYWSGIRNTDELTTWLFDPSNACSAQRSEFGSLFVDLTQVVQVKTDDCVGLGAAVVSAGGLLATFAVGGLVCALTAGVGCAAVVLAAGVFVGAPLGAVVGGVAGQEYCEAEKMDGLDSAVSFDLSPIYNHCLKGGVTGDVQITLLDGEVSGYEKGTAYKCATNAASGEGTCHVTLQEGFVNGRFLVETNLYRDA